MSGNAAAPLGVAVTMRTVLLLPLALLATPGTEAAPAIDRVRCSFDDGPEQACAMTDVVTGGIHRMTFVAGRNRATFAGRENTGWWAGKLNGKPAMGYQRNRGNTVFSSYDLSTSFAWWYPQNAHGTY